MRQLKGKDFPKLLREIPDKPSLLYIRGELPSPDLKYLCVVGSRACSIYGKRMTQKLIAGLASYPVAIISGLALGIDSEAHKAALDVGLPTVAVLPSSADDASLYPASHVPLAQRILAAGGALVSEYKAPFKPATYSFPARNRIMSGMSVATLIIEAGEKSGTLITARLALDYNREVLAVPHELGRETGAGVNRLLREGATLVRGGADILQALGLKEKDIPEQIPLPTDLTKDEARVLHALTEALVRDELIERAELSAQEANVALSSLLIRGLITERLGKIERA
ncbi:DNA protecting protein DprA [Candidatus Adlerbacteria bacterium RIFCSPLOWO2_01_FULL_51_16]|uniref:DNA protecting protein DprA n=1 Tax=Candidatus Adlerbacteria bacterium RIFCSPLOWO2_01_FULL_51_16 TaxID=1797243 RepID=A0A1F4XGU9_9BACT|nr:MAG: DNA protecting protein DprA [Candidatus Adlerbacteria bacterium RIFCSPLOWO2_01_FULL_51_16]